MRMLSIVLVAATLSACATTGDRASLDPRDPMEGFNRGVWEFNQGLDKGVVKPATTVYRAVTPPPARRGLSRLLSNLLEPWNALNSLLQGKPDRAFNSLGRFVVNSTIGVGGLADHATDLGLPPTPEDLGQTLAVLGVKNSAYLVLPVLGPSTVRDGIGTGVQLLLFDPVGIALDEAGASDAIKYSTTGVRILNARSDVIDSGVDALLETSADSYAAARDAYFQRREAEIADRTAAVGADEEQRLLDQAIEDAQPEGGEPPSDDAPVGEEPPSPSIDTEPPAADPAEAEAAPPQLSLVLPEDERIAY